MNYFQFYPHDQVSNNWLIFNELKVSPFVVIKPRYAECICRECKTIDHDKAFGQGFDSEIKVRAKHDLFGTSDGFICINENVKKIIDEKGYTGIACKAVSNTQWWVVSLTCRVNADVKAYSTSKQVCLTCGRPKEVVGRICCLNQIEVPTKKGAFFTPTFDRGGSINGDRDMFVTEDIVMHLKANKIKGGMFLRLLNSDEHATIKAAGFERNLPKWPKDFKVIL